MLLLKYAQDKGACWPGITRLARELHKSKRTVKRYQDQLERLALQDPLTYAGNRRMMRRDLTAALSSRRRSGRNFTLVLLDLDHFKNINDRWGHDVGDRVLCDFADLVRSEIRADDGFYRFGGEEFVLLLPDHGDDDAIEVARSLHRRISGRLVHDGDAIRFSAGVAVLGDSEDWPAWLTRADRAMYRAKHAGRNRVEAAEQPPPEPAGAASTAGRPGRKNGTAPVTTDRCVDGPEETA
jgi:diguanylate cyclase (GGDEF)-like protein